MTKIVLLEADLRFRDLEARSVFFHYEARLVPSAKLTSLI